MITDPEVTLSSDMGRVLAEGHESHWVRSVEQCPRGGPRSSTGAQVVCSCGEKFFLRAKRPDERGDA